jgi:hypothetical protein
MAVELHEFMTPMAQQRAHWEQPGHKQHHTKRCMQPALRNARWSRAVRRHCILKQSAQTAVLGLTHSPDCHHVTRLKPSAVRESSSWTPLIPQPLRDPQPRHSTFDNRNPPPRCISHSLIPFPFRFYGIVLFIYLFIYKVEQQTPLSFWCLFKLHVSTHAGHLQV